MDGGVSGISAADAHKVVLGLGVAFVRVGEFGMNAGAAHIS